jgi:NADH-quinone oxidoreductase subunit N
MLATMLVLLLPYALLCLLPLFLILAIAAVLARSKPVAFVLGSAILAAEAAMSAYLLYANADVLVLNTFHIYAFSTLFAALFSTTLLLVNILAFKYSKDYAENLLMLSLVLAGAVILPASNTLLALLVCLELIAVPTAFMMLLTGRRNVEAAVKFFIMSAVAMAMFSFALVLVFPYGMQMALVALVANSGIGGTALAMLALVLFVAALGIGAELFPFNLWVPDVYEGARSYVTAMLSGVNKTVALVALLEISLVVFAAYKSTFSSIALLLSVATMFFGNQRSVKRLLSYSSISQAGYILIGFAAASQLGIEASIFQIIAHAFMAIGAFAIVLWLESNDLMTIEDYAGLGNRSKFAAVSLTLLMLSMAGMPPLMGFVGKFLLFSSAIDSGMLLLAAIGILNSFISVFYFARVISAMFSSTEHAALRVGHYAAAVVVAALAVLLAFGIYPQPLIAAAQLASKALLGI